MSTDGANNGTRWLPRLMGVLLLLMGLALLAGGIKLSQLGGSLYYLLAGIGFALSGILLLAKRRIALGLYGLVLFASTVWALWEVGLDWWQLVPRLAMWFAIGVVLLLPWAVARWSARRQDGHRPAERGRGAGRRHRRGQPVHPPGRNRGELGRDTAK
jgi:quinoprotein glucose dehydrogenase